MKLFERFVNVKKSEEKFKKETKGEKLEKTDPLAMIIAAFIVFIPALLVVFGLAFVLLWIF